MQYTEEYDVSQSINFLHLSHVKRNRPFAYAKTKMQVSLAVTAQLISDFVFFSLHSAISYLFLNLKFQAFSHLL